MNFTYPLEASLRASGTSMINFSGKCEEVYPVKKRQWKNRPLEKNSSIHQLWHAVTPKQFASIKQKLCF